MALPTLSVVAVLVLMLVFKWKLRRQAWFWITMAVIAALHVLLLLLVPWTTKWVPAVVTAGIVSGDTVLIFWIVDAIGSLVEAPHAAEG